MSKIIDDDQIVRLYCEEKRTTWEIAAAIGIAQATVYAHLKRMGKIRNRKQASYVRFERKPPKHYIENNGHGYREVFMPLHPNAKKSGFILEHRLIMSQILGRPLEPYEQVHHLNGNGQDNRPENLVLITSNTEHKKYHRRSDEELLEKLRDHAMRIQGIPTVATCQADKTMPSITTYSARFGSWTNAKVLAGVALSAERFKTQKAA